MVVVGVEIGGSGVGRGELCGPLCDLIWLAWLVERAIYAMFFPPRSVWSVRMRR